MANKVLRSLTLDNVSQDIPGAGENLEIDANNLLKIISSPDLKGTPTAPTNTTPSTNNTQIANTAFVQSALLRRLPNALSVNITNTTVASVAHNTVTTLDMWTPTVSGLFVGNACVTFASNATGYRFADMLFNGGTLQSGLRVMAVSNADTQLNITIVAKVTANQKFTLRYSQGSGAALNVKLRAFRGVLFAD